MSQAANSCLLSYALVPCQANPAHESLISPLSYCQQHGREIDNLRGRLQNYNKLAKEEIDRGEYCNDKQLARYQMQVQRPENSAGKAVGYSQYSTSCSQLP